MKRLLSISATARPRRRDQQEATRMLKRAALQPRSPKRMDTLSDPAVLDWLSSHPRKYGNLQTIVYF